VDLVAKATEKVLAVLVVMAIVPTTVALSAKGDRLSAQAATGQSAMVQPVADALADAVSVLVHPLLPQWPPFTATRC
jgi:hypothetical protein